MNIIDAHLHFWDLKNKINSWVLNQENQPFFNKSYIPKDLFQTSNLYGVVHIEAHDSDIPTILEIQWLNSIMQEYKSIKYAHIAFADITLPKDEFRIIIDQIKGFKFVKGIRHILSHHPNYQYNPCDNNLSEHKNILNNLCYLKENGLIFNCQMYPYQLNNFLKQIENSHVICVIDHMALPIWNNENDQKIWEDIIIKISNMKNIYIKLSGLDMFKQESEFAGVINHCLDNLSINSLIYGSNYPVSCTKEYNSWYKYLDNLITSREQKEHIFFTNANNLFFKSFY